MAAIHADGRVLVTFGSYARQNSGIAVEPPTTEDLRSSADALFGFDGSERQARTARGRLTPDRAVPSLEFCRRVAQAHAAALGDHAARAEAGGAGGAVVVAS